MEQEIINLITDKIKNCNEMCFCKTLTINENTMISQRRCGNCHSKDILIELLNEVNDLDLIKNKVKGLQTS